MTTATATTFTTATHNGKLTISNPATGEHRTFRIKTQKDDARFAPGSRIVGLLIGQDNENDFQQFGFVNTDGSVIVWNKYRGTQFEKLAKMLSNLEESCQRWNLNAAWSVKCRRCNRELTTPDSIESGIGPTCSEA
jgi:hypothetical protein